MRFVRVLAALAASLLFVMPASPAFGATGSHCVVQLVPLFVRAGVVEAAAVDAGCYETYAEALSAGSAGAIDIGLSTTPESLTDAQLDLSTTVSLSASVVIGTEWIETNYSSQSKSYFASATCSAAITWEVDYVTDAWNDEFESGKGFGGCDANRKFQHANFGGSSVLCSPNCATYGSLNNAVSSLRWRH